MRLTVEGLSCVRGGRKLFADLDFIVAAGEALAIRGPNGSGKSSLLRLIAGLLRPAAGRVALEGLEVGQPVGAAAHLVGHLDAVKDALSVAENLAFMQTLLGAAQPVDPALARLGLGPLADLPARMLSAGQKRRLGLARLLAAPRPLWLLDEPTTALDADAQDTLAAMMRDHLSGGGLLLVATHTELAVPNLQEIRLGYGGAG